MPYENEKALKFCEKLVDKYNIPLDHIHNVGDEFDLFFASLYPKGADYPHTPNQEILLGREKSKEWGKSFPKMNICFSNHVFRYWKKASFAELPSQMLRTWKEFIGAPKGWKWADDFLIKTEIEPFMICHGEEFSGAQAHLLHALHYGINTAIGHHHALAGIEHARTKTRQIWGAACGCLIDKEAYAFRYGEKSKRKPMLGTLVVLDGGRLPIWEPLCV